MVRKMISALLLPGVMAGNLYAQPFSFYYGTPGIPEHMKSLVADVQGNFLIMGDRVSHVDPSGVQPSNTDLEYFKVNGQGDLIWSRIIDSTIYDAGVSILEENNGQYVMLTRYCNTVLGGIGCVKQNPRIYRLDHDGNILWHRDYELEMHPGRSHFIKTPDGGYAMFGLTRQANDDHDLFLLKINADGEEEWTAFVPTNNGTSFDMRPAAGGGYYISGATPKGTDLISTPLVAKISASGEVLWIRYYPNNRYLIDSELIAPISDGFVLLLTYPVALVFPPPPPPNTDVVMIRLDGDGNIVWNKELADDIRSVNAGTTSTDGIVLTGIEYLPVEDEKIAKVVKYDFDGNLVWAIAHDLFPDYYEHPNNIIKTENGFTIGGFTEIPDSIVWLISEDFMLFQINENGSLDSLSIPNPITEPPSGRTVLVYPNPASSNIFFELTRAAEGTHEVLLFNTLGQLCNRRAFQGQTCRMDAIQLPSGLYIYEIRRPNGNLVAKGKLVLDRERF